MKFFDKKINKILAAALVAVFLLVAVTFLFTNTSTDTATESADSAMAEVNPEYKTLFEETKKPTEPTEDATQPTTSEKASSEQTTASRQKTTSAKATTVKAKTTTAAATVHFATAIPVDEPADHQAQWDAGYLVAIDNPDETYECAKVTLTDEDRDLLERLCMGEFGSGGFIGAALIAQAVKDAMCFDGYKTVEEVIENCHYTGSTSIGTNDACIRAVKYIFDENHDAVQHRIMYMYNPEMVQSSFHESQNYILTYQSVRFFDRWGY